MEPEHQLILDRLEQMDERLDTLEQNALPHIDERLRRLERLAYVITGLLVGSGAVEITKLVT